MSKLRLLTIFSIGLLIVNIILVGIMVSKKGSKRNNWKKPNPVELFTRELNLNDGQKAKLEIIVKEQEAFMNTTRAKVEPLKKELRTNIMEPNSSFNKDSLFTELGTIQADVESKFHEHFIQIRKLCEGEQIDKFEKLLEKMPERRGPRRNRKR